MTKPGEFSGFLDAVDSAGGDGNDHIHYEHELLRWFRFH